MKTITQINLSHTIGASAANILRKVSTGFLLVITLLLSNTADAQNGLYTCGYIDGFTGGSPAVSKKNGVTPFPSGIQNQKSQYLYKAQELTQTPNLAPQSGGAITSISFYVTDLPTVNGVGDAPYTLKGYTVKLGHTTAGNLNTASFGSDFMTLYSGAVSNYIGDLTVSEENAWVTIELETPFIWNGSHGIIVEICKSNTTAQLDSSRSNIEVRATDTGASNRLARGYYTVNSYSSTGTSGCSLSATNNSNATNAGSGDTRYRPDIRFQFACNGNPAGGVAEIDGPAIAGGTGCAEVTLKIENGAQNSGLTYIWEKADNIDMVGATVIAEGPQQTTVKVKKAAVDMYYRRKSGCGGAFQNSAPKKVDAAEVNIYTGGSWTSGAPTASSQRRLVVNDNLVVSSDMKSCGCEVKPGKNVIVESGVTLQIDSHLKVDGTLTFEDGASLIQKNADAVNTGNIVYKRISQPLYRFDFTYWSSPVKTQTLVSLSPNTLSDKYYSFDPTTQGWVVENKNNEMLAGKGYIIRAPQTFNVSGTATEFPGTFSGVPNNGDVPVTITTGTNKFNLIGNPYPSAVDAQAFYNYNADKLDGTFYFWSHHTPITNANYAATDYAVWNQMGSVAGSPSGSEMVSNGYIAAGQSFMVKGKTGTPVAPSVAMFTNDMRKGGGLNNTFFRASQAPVVTDQNAAITEKHRVWLNLSNAQAFKQILVGYAAGATNAFDNGFDGTAMAGAKLSFYSIQDDNQLAIQARSLPFNPSDVVALGFQTTVAGNHTVSLPQYDGVFASQQVFLEDKQLNVMHNLKDGAYTFTSAAGTFTSRFALRFGAASSLDVKVKQADAVVADAVMVFKQSQDLMINGGSAMIDSVEVYDLSGRLLTSQAGYNSNEIVMANPNWASQVLIVQLTTTDKAIITKKVVF